MHKILYVSFMSKSAKHCCECFTWNRDVDRLITGKWEESPLEKQALKDTKTHTKLVTPHEIQYKSTNWVLKETDKCIGSSSMKEHCTHILFLNRPLESFLRAFANPSYLHRQAVNTITSSSEMFTCT